MSKKIPSLIFLCFLLFPLSVRAEEVLTWEDCLAEAKKNNPDLISAVEVVNQQKADERITASGLYPQIDASLGASTSMTKSTSSSGVKTRTTTDSYSYGVSGDQLIFDGFKTINNVNAAKENIKAWQQNYRFVSTQIRMDLRSAFVNLLTAQELIKVTEEVIKIRRSNLILITLRYESGLEHKGALLTAEANIAQANFDLAQAKRQLEFAQAQLNQQMGRKDFKPMLVKGDFNVIDYPSEKPDLEQIIKNNPLVLEAAAQKNAAAFDIKSAYGNFAPELTGTGGVGKSSAHWPPKDDNWNAGLSLNLPLFEGGLRLAQVDQTKAAYKQALADEKSARDTAIVTLEQTWADLVDAVETIGVQQKTLEANQERSKISDAQYSTGFVTFDNWIIIQNDLVKSKIAYLGAQSNALIAEANWIQAKGETLEYAQ